MPIQVTTKFDEKYHRCKARDCIVMILKYQCFRDFDVNKYGFLRYIIKAKKLAGTL